MPSQNAWTSELAAEFIDERIDSSVRKFAVAQSPTLVSFREWCVGWDWAKRSDVYTHQIHQYPAKLLAYIPIAFLTSTLSSSTEPVMDSFAGTGTVGLECLVHEFCPRTFYGVEINPLARLIAKVKTTPLASNRLQSLKENLGRKLDSATNIKPPEFTNRDMWFRKSVQTDLARLRYCIDNLDASPAERDFFRVCFSAIIRDMSRADPDIAPPVLMKSSKFPKNQRKAVQARIAKKQRANAIRLFFSQVDSNIERMGLLVDKTGIEPRHACHLIWDDARSISFGNYTENGQVDKSNPETRDSSVGMVITSPPYIAAQKYVRTTKLEMLWLGLATEEEVREIDRETIGAERVPATQVREFLPSDNQQADKLLIKIFKNKPDRAAIASQYFREMRQALSSIHRVLQDDGTLILVVGNNTVDGKNIPNHSILAEIACENNRFSVLTILRDPIRSRGMLTKRHATGGLIDDEYVLILKKRVNK